MKIFDPKLTGSIEVLNTITGDITLSGNLNVGGNLEGSITGSVTASYIDLANVDGSASLASNISANSASASALSAATSSYLLNTTDTFTGDLTVTGEVIAQTLHVQQVTSSIVYSSGSNLFGETVADTQKFTGSLQVSGSDHYLLGNVGIGTDSPTFTLDLPTGNARFNDIRLNDGRSLSSTADGSSYVVLSPNDGDVILNASANTKGIDFQLGAGNIIMSVTGSNVGIGTTSPLVKLDTRGSISAQLDTAYYRLRRTNGTDVGYITDSTTWGDSGTDFSIGASSANLRFYTNNSVAERMNIDSSGNLNFSTADGVGITFKESGFITIDSDNNDSSRNFQFKDGSGDVLMTILDTGNVGIGNTPTGGLLDVGVNAGGNALLLRNGDISTGTGNDIQIKFGFENTDDFAHFIRTRHNSSDLNNAIDFYTCDGTENNATFPTGSRLNLSLNSGKVGIGIDNPSTTLNVGHANHGIGMAYLGGDSLPSIAGLFTDNSANGGSGYGDLHIKSRSDYGVYGMFFHTAASNNVPEMRMVIKNDGSIGIGTTTTRARMNFPNIVDTNGYDVGTLRFYDNGDSIFYGIGVSNAQFNLRAGTTSDSFAFWTGTTHRMQIQGTTGNVGIGTNSPTKQLEVKNSYNGSQLTLRSTSGNSGNAGLRFGIADNTVTTDNYHKASIWLTGDGTGNALGDLTFNINNVASSANVGSSDERMRITRSGNVGIGVTPADTFNFGRALDVGSTTGAFLYLRDTDYANGVGGIGMSSGNLYISNKAAGDIRFFTNNDADERMRITSVGYLKASNYGTYFNSSDTYHEFISNENNWTILTGNTNANPFGILVEYTTNANGSSNFPFYFNVVGVGKRIAFRSDGGLENIQANDVNLSDERVKKDIAPLTSYWDKFKALEVVTFKYKDQTHDDDNIGFIAQQVEQVAPEFISNEGWQQDAFDNEEEPLKAIYTADMYNASIKVLQEAMLKIEALEAEIQTLKNS